MNFENLQIHAKNELSLILKKYHVDSIYIHFYLEDSYFCVETLNEYSLTILVDKYVTVFCDEDLEKYYFDEHNKFFFECKIKEKELKDMLEEIRIVLIKLYEIDFESFLKIFGEFNKDCGIGIKTANLKSDNASAESKDHFIMYLDV